MCWEVCLGHCRMYSSIPGHCALHSPYPVWQQKTSPDTAKCSLGHKIILRWKSHPSTDNWICNGLFPLNIFLDVELLDQRRWPAKGLSLCLSDCSCRRSRPMAHHHPRPVIPFPFLSTTEGNPRYFNLCQFKSISLLFKCIFKLLVKREILKCFWNIYISSLVKSFFILSC